MMIQSRTLVARLAAIPYTGAISDILDEMGLTNQVLPKEIQSIQPGQTLAGRALTLLGGAHFEYRPGYYLSTLSKNAGTASTW